MTRDQIYYGTTSSIGALGNQGTDTDTWQNDYIITNWHTTDSISSPVYLPILPIGFFCVQGECFYCEENSYYNMDIGILVCKECFKKALDSILGSVSINKKAIQALKHKGD